MEKKELEKARKQLVSLIKTWKLNLPVLAEATGMPLGTFKSKLYESGGKYRFTEAEFMEVGNAVDKMLVALQSFCEMLDTRSSYIV